jgi:hypothetical protein
MARAVDLLLGGVRLVIVADLPTPSSSLAQPPHFPMSPTKPSLLILGDPAETIRWHVQEFQTWAKNYEIKVNVDFSRSAFQTALREKKYPHAQRIKLTF